MEFGEDNNINNFYLSKEYLNYSASTINGVANPLTSDLDANFFGIYNLGTNNNPDDAISQNNAENLINDSSVNWYLTSYDSLDSQNETKTYDFQASSNHKTDFYLKIQYSDTAGTKNISVTNPNQYDRMTIVLTTTSRPDIHSFGFVFNGFTHSIVGGATNLTTTYEYIYINNCWIEKSTYTKNC
jgi:hypothetical protein